MKKENLIKPLCKILCLLNKFIYLKLSNAFVPIYKYSNFLQQNELSTPEQFLYAFCTHKNTSTFFTSVESLHSKFGCNIYSSDFILIIIIKLTKTVLSPQIYL